MPANLENSAVATGLEKVSFHSNAKEGQLNYGTTALIMPANLENSAVATGLEKISFHSNPKERQCQRMFKLLHSCIHLTH